MRSSITLTLVAVMGCAANPVSPVSPASPGPAIAGSPAASVGTGASSGGAKAPLDAGQLVGSWAEYWAARDGDGVGGTQRYVFFADGRFGWRGAADVGLTAGRYRVDGAALVLSVERAEAEGAAAGERRLELGDCPPNDEARGIDASYRCVGIAGKAFWRRADAAPADAAVFFPN